MTEMTTWADDRDRIRELVCEKDRLREALQEARPYVYNRTSSNDWRGETARDVLGRVDAALKPAAQGPIGP